MQKAVVAAAGLVAVVVGSVTGVAAWSGSKVVGRLEQQTDELQKVLPMVKVVDKKVERGLFTTVRTFSLQFGCLPSAAQLAVGGAKPGAPEPIRISWRDVIHHGPFPGGAGLGFATIDSELVAPAAYQARIDKLTDKHPLLSIHTAVDLTGATTSDLTVPALHHEEPELGEFRSDVLRAHVRGSAPAGADGSGSYSTALESVSFSSRATDGTAVALKLGAFSGQTEVGARKDASLWFAPSKTSGRLGSLDLLGTAAKGMPIKPVQASFSDLKFAAESKLDQGLFSSTSQMTCKGTVNKVAIDQVELRSSIRRIHAATYQKLLGTLFGSMLSCDPAVQQAAMESMFSEVQKELSALLVHNPEYSLDTLAVVLAGKRAELSYSIGTSGVTADDAAQPLPAILLGKGVLKAAAKIDKALVAKAVAQLGGMDPAASAAAGLPPGATPAEISGMVDGMTEQFVQAGYLEREGDAIKASASYEQGKVLVNGKPMALPDFGALGGK